MSPSDLSRFSGGRHLDAIALNPHFSASVKILLLAIGSKLNFNDEFQNQRWIRVEELCLRTSLSRRTVMRCLRWAETNGYLTVEEKHDTRGRQQPSLYGLTRKVFTEYTEGGGHSDKGEGVTMTSSGESQCAPRGVTMTSHNPNPNPKEEYNYTHTSCSGEPSSSPPQDKNSLEVEAAYQAVRTLCSGEARKSAGSWRGIARLVVEKGLQEQLKSSLLKAADEGYLGQVVAATLVQKFQLQSLQPPPSHLQLVRDEDPDPPPYSKTWT